MNKKITRSSVLAGSLACLFSMALGAQAATITITGGSNYSLSPGTAVDQNNVVNNTTNLYAGNTGLQGASGWNLGGTVGTNLSSYTVDWYFLGAESGNTITLSSGSPAFS